MNQGDEVYRLKPTTLSKSRFKVALECPRKLDYLRDDEFHDASQNDAFLQSLADAGHQVGELARRSFPGGHLISARGQKEQIRQTAELLRERDVTIYEATIQHENLLVRVDILEKKGDQLRLIEVKSRGFDALKDWFLAKKKGSHPVTGKWREYIYDVAFQAHVVGQAYPYLAVTPFLMLLDKNQPITIDGLNTMFRVHRDDKDVTVQVTNEFHIEQLQPSPLRLAEVTNEVAQLRSSPVEAPGMVNGFEGFIGQVSSTLAAGASFAATAGPACKECQFYVDPAEAADKGRSGWHECLAAYGVQASTRREQTVFALHRLHRNRLEEILSERQPLELATAASWSMDDSNPSLDEITIDHRQMLQMGEARGEVTRPFLMEETIRGELDALTYPLHFIDFETAAPALPYHRGRKPHDVLLFQFSHHVLHRDGRIEHRSECLKATPGEAPSIPVLRELRAALCGDGGSVIHWATHEATVLSALRGQIGVDKPADADELRAFIDAMVGTGERPGRLFDLCALVSRTAFYPGTGGSSSIKVVLPAVLKHSRALQELFRKPIYGTAEMPSRNFRDWTWIRTETGEIDDPYSLLGSYLDTQAAISGGASSEVIADGGGALLAYASLQEKGLSDANRQQLKSQLLRYCELDTLAMVMVTQHALEVVRAPTRTGNTLRLKKRSRE